MASGSSGETVINKQFLTLTHVSHRDGCNKHKSEHNLHTGRYYVYNLGRRGRRSEGGTAPCSMEAWPTASTNLHQHTKTKKHTHTILTIKVIQNCVHTFSQHVRYVFYWVKRLDFKTSRTGFMHFESKATSVNNGFLNKAFSKVFLNN